MTLRTYFLLFGMVLCVAVALIFLQLPGNTLFWQSVQNSGHAIIFTSLSLGVLLYIERLRRIVTFKALVVSSASLFLVGFFIELAQYATGRGASFSDILLNSAGIISGNCLYVVFNSVKQKTMGSSKALFALLLGAIVMAWSIQRPATLWVAGLYRPTLPILADFEAFGAHHFVRGNRSTQSIAIHRLWQHNNSQSLRTIFEPGRWPNIQFQEPEKNWSDFSRLSFNAYNPLKDTLQIRIRIDDQSLGLLDDDHMTVSHELVHGMNLVDLDFDRFKEDALLRKRPGKPTFKEIASFMIYISSVKNHTVVYFDDFTLQ